MQVIKKRKVCDENGAVYYLICMTGSREEIKFRIPKKVFRDVTEDEYLAVTHKGTRFLAYEKDTRMLED